MALFLLTKSGSLLYINQKMWEYGMCELFEIFYCRRLALSKEYYIINALNWPFTTYDLFKLKVIKNISTFYKSKKKNSPVWITAHACRVLVSWNAPLISLYMRLSEQQGQQSTGFRMKMLRLWIKFCITVVPDSV